VDGRRRGRDDRGAGGLGYLIVDARNGLRMDLVVCGMIVIGAIGILLDVAFARLGRIESLRWGFEK
jgi:NitT/TauT family transport system permease protein